MDADTGNGGLRAKRCLPAEFHPGTAHQNSPKAPIDPKVLPTRALSVPKSGRTIVTAPNSANSRFFTDCYPISAVFEPKLNQITPWQEAIWIPPMNHEVDN